MMKINKELLKALSDGTKWKPALTRISSECNLSVSTVHSFYRRYKDLFVVSVRLPTIEEFIGLEVDDDD